MKKLQFNHPVRFASTPPINWRGIFHRTATFLLFSFSSFSSFAQVNIGSSTPPNTFSALEINAQYKTGIYGGFRLPQMTTAQRDALGLTSAAECKGLMIFNLTTDCIETWNGKKWLSFCDDSGTSGDVGVTVNGAGGTKLKFMNYNLGAASNVQSMTAAQQAAHTTPEDTYGDIYQWGRMADGHEKRTSATTAGPVSALNANGQPTGTAIGKFITNASTPYDWRTPQNDNLWGKPKTVQDPCPAGWRVPTLAEWQAVMGNNSWTWQSTPVAGYKISPDGGTTTTIFLPAAGNRTNSGGTLSSVAALGNYWSSSVADIYALRLSFSSESKNVFNDYRAPGYSVRCIAE